jgi:hypothetical protein
MENKGFIEIPSKDTPDSKYYISLTSKTTFFFNKILLSINLYQELERQIVNNPSIKKYFILFNDQKDCDIFKQLSSIFNYNFISEDKKLRLTELRVDKTKTYLFRYKKYDNTWLLSSIPKFVKREKDNGMQYIRFLALFEETKDMLILPLVPNYNLQEYYIKYIYSKYKEHIYFYSLFFLSSVLY